MLLKEFLAPEQIDDLRLLAKQREWTSLLFLIRKLYEISKEELMAFTTTDQAIERRGKAAGIKTTLDAIQSTYNEAHKDNGSGTRDTSDSSDSSYNSSPDSYAY